MAILDSTYLGFNLIITVGMQLFFFFIAYTFQFDKVTDIAGTMNFVLLAVLNICLQATYFPRQILITSLVCLWGLRLGLFLLNRVLQRKNDARFEEFRHNFAKFMGFWIFQMLWVWIVSLPVTLTNAGTNDAPLNGLDWFGLALWIIGFIIESVSDQSKYSFTQNSRENKGKFIKSDFWAYSRHPNYFGEIVCWLSIYLISINACAVNFSGAGYYVGALSPIFTFCILILLSGMPLAEARADEKFKGDPEYIRYKLSTSPLVPMPNSLYSSLPKFVKKYLLLELDMFNTNFTTAAPENE